MEAGFSLFYVVLAGSGVLEKLMSTISGIVGDVVLFKQDVVGVGHDADGSAPYHINSGTKALITNVISDDEFRQYKLHDIVEVMVGCTIVEISSHLFYDVCCCEIVSSGG